MLTPVLLEPDEDADKAPPAPWSAREVMSKGTNTQIKILGGKRASEGEKWLILYPSK